MSDVDLQPTDLEALQAETDDLGPAARVQIVGIDGPVRTQELPRKGAGAKTKLVGITPVEMLRADHRRAVARIVSVGANMLVAFTSASADPAVMALWPANVPLVLTADSGLWVAAATGTTQVSVVTEFWATGQ